MSTINLRELLIGYFLDVFITLYKYKPFTWFSSSEYVLFIDNKSTEAPKYFLKTVFSTNRSWNETKNYITEAAAE